jgi:hypothetical protein
MKTRPLISWLVPIAVALVFSGLLLRNARDLAQLQAQKETLRSQVLDLGSNPDAPLHLSQRSLSPGTRPDLREIARAYLRCGHEFKDAYNEHAIRELDPASRARIAAALDGVVSLNREGLRELIQILRDEPGLDPGVQRNLLTFALAHWGTMDRSALLEYLLHSPGLEEQLQGNSPFLQRTQLTSWIKEAPSEVLAWMRKNRDELPKEFLESATWNFARSMAMTDPLGTFELVREFADEPGRYFPGIFRDSKLSVAERTEVISRLTEMAEELGDGEERQKFLSKNLKPLVLSFKGGESDFRTAVETIEAAHLEPDQIDFLWNPAVTDLGSYIKQEEMGQWILWLREKAPVGPSQIRIKQLLERWQKRNAEEAAEFIRRHQINQ